MENDIWGACTATPKNGDTDLDMIVIVMKFELVTLFSGGCKYVRRFRV
jgi:hypothetical protein